MPLFSENTTNLINGVSQQADALRFPSQHSEQINALSSAINGLSKRPYTENIAKIYPSSLGDIDDVFFHWVNRDDEEQYLIVVRGKTSPTIEAFDLAGNSVNVLTPGGSTPNYSYLATNTPRTSLKALTVGDTIFLLNTEKTASLGVETADPRDPEALIFVKSVRSTSAITVELFNTLGSTAVTYTTTVTAGSSDDQESVAAAIITGLDGVSANNDYTYSQEDGVIHIVRTDGSDFRLNVKSDVPGGAYSIKDEIQGLTDLPAKGYINFTVRIKGDPDDTNNVYYVKYVPVDTLLTSGFAEGSWEETVQPGIIVNIDPSTMPHRLVSNGVDFRYSSVEWEDRLVGEDETNPPPSFIDRKINNMFFFKNRLGFLSDENVVMSQVGQFFNFWQTTVISLLDDAVIDISPSAADIIKLRTAIELEGELLLFADGEQFIIASEGSLTPKTVSATRISTATYDQLLEPIKVANSIYFSFKRGDFTGINEYIRVDQFQPFQVSDVTRHVPRYLEGNIRQLETFAAQNMVAAISDEYRNGIYFYVFLDQAANRVQSSWSKFEFGGEVHSLKFIDSEMYMCIGRGDGVYLEKIELSFDQVEPDLDYLIYMDRRVDETAVSSLSYDAGLDATTFVLPYIPDPGATLDVVTRQTSTTTGGRRLNSVTYSGSTVSVPGDISSLNFYVGQRYTMEVTLTKPILRSRGQSSSASGQSTLTPVNTAITHIRYLYINYDDTMQFSVEVASEGKDTFEYDFDSADIGTYEDIVNGPPPLEDGIFKVPIFERDKHVVITLKNDTPLPCNLLSLTWEGFAHDRTRN